MCCPTIFTAEHQLTSTSGSCLLAMKVFIFEKCGDKNKDEKDKRRFVNTSDVRGLTAVVPFSCVVQMEETSTAHRPLVNSMQLAHSITGQMVEEH